MKTRVLLAGAMAVSTLFALPVHAGDQPVFVTTVGGPDSGYYKNNTIRYYFDTVRGPVMVAQSANLGASVQGANAAVASGTSVGAVSLSQRDSNALYSRLVAEARERGLK